MKNCFEPTQKIEWLIFRLFLPVYVQRLLQNKVPVNRTEVHSIVAFVQFNEDYLVLVGSDSGTSCGRLLVYLLMAVVDWLIKCVKLTPAFVHSPGLNRSSPRLDTTDLLALFFYHFSPPPLTFPMIGIFCFIRCPKRQGSVNDFLVALVITEEDAFSSTRIKSIFGQRFCQEIKGQWI